mmetsp:Transcript_30373/g.54570  ORF Transcript_30373/g.54570 Transcript_30373/m.54570 type:complete len:200 (-) Transcript_30373:533-1132(-)
MDSERVEPPGNRGLAMVTKCLTSTKGGTFLHPMATLLVGSPQNVFQPLASVARFESSLAWGGGGAGVAAAPGAGPAPLAPFGGDAAALGGRGGLDFLGGCSSVGPDESDDNSLEEEELSLLSRTLAFRTLALALALAVALGLGLEGLLAFGLSAAGLALDWGAGLGLGAAPSRGAVVSLRGGISGGLNGEGMKRCLAGS